MTHGSPPNGPATALLAAIVRATPTTARPLLESLTADDFDDWRARHIYAGLVAVFDELAGHTGDTPAGAMLLEHLMTAGHLDNTDTGESLRRYLTAIVTTDADPWHAPYLARVHRHQTYRRRIAQFGELLQQQAPGASLETLDRTMSDGVTTLRRLRLQLDTTAPTKPATAPADGGDAA